MTRFAEQDDSCAADGVGQRLEAWGAPTVALFGPTDPALWSPIGPSVVVIRSSDGSMDSISPEKVLSVVASQDA